MASKYSKGDVTRDDDFYRNTALHHCCDIVSNGCNIVPTLSALLRYKSSLRIVPCNITLKQKGGDEVGSDVLLKFLTSSAISVSSFSYL